MLAYILNNPKEALIRNSSHKEDSDTICDLLINL